jgi:uncharacterized protein YndB with AHSA1/START domain
MYEFITKSTIRATPERVWEILTDAACYREWNPEIVGIEGGNRWLLRGTQGSRRAG